MLYGRKPLSHHFTKLLPACVVVVCLTATADAHVAILTPVGFPPNVTLCQPVNFTWTGGAPPYWLYIYGDVGSGKLVAQNTTGIPTTWFVWIPDIPVVPESSIRIQIGGANAVMRGGVSLSRLIGEDTSCLNSTSTAAAAATAPSSASALTSSQPQPGTSLHTTGHPAPSSQSGQPPDSPSPSAALSKAAVAGIAAAATFACTMLVLAAVWFVLARCRSRARQLQQGTADVCPSPYPYPVVTSATEKCAPASGATPPVHILPPTNSFPPAIQVTRIEAESDSELGYSVVADVGGPNSRSPGSPSLELATGPPPSPRGNLDSNQPEDLVRWTPHQEPGRKCGRVLIEPRPHEFQEVPVGEREGGRTSSGELESGHDAQSSIARAEPEAWQVASPSDLPPYVP